MQVSLNWLKELISIEQFSLEQITESLTDIGLEVEAIQKRALFGDQVVIGQIITADKHPNADSLKLCTVDVGRSDTLQIVCGAPNARAGLKTAVALVGSELPGGLKIKEAKIRNVESFGMMCSGKELGLSASHEGILELDSSLKCGSTLLKALKLDDVILTLNITPNRADCLGHIGVARDLGARLGKELKLPSTSIKPGSFSTKDLQVQLDSNGCTRFTAVTLRNVKTTSSPTWLRQRIESMGMRPINLMVDLTNYVMLETNHPMHAYDERDIKGRKITVREAKDGESFKTLDGVERSLRNGDLLICDGERVIGLAGIMGGLNSEVKEDTSAIILEVAHFDPVAIRTTARRLGIHSEASHRFERGVDLLDTDKVIQRFVSLMQQCVEELNQAGASLPLPEHSTDRVDIFPVKPQPRLIALRLSEAKSFLASPNLNQDRIRKLFEGLGIRLVDQTQDRMVFETPTWRVDLERECDLIEEIARMIGYDKIPYQLPSMSLQPLPEDALVEFIESARIEMASLGLRETISFPFWSDLDPVRLKLPEHHPLHPSIKLLNPIADDAKWMHTSLVAALIKSTSQNRRHGVKGTKLFELGRGYFDMNQKPLDRSSTQVFKNLDRKGRHLSLRARDEKNRPIERHWIGGILDQPWTLKSWEQTEASTTFFHGKSIVNSWLKAFGIQDAQYHRPNATDLPFLHPGACAYLFVKGQVLGWIGELHPEVAMAYDFEPANAPLVFEFDLESVLDVSGKRSAIPTTLFKFPPSTRDLALLVDQNLTHDQIVTSIQKFPQKRNLRQWNIFDVYQGKNIPDQKKSVAWSFSFQSAEKTLTDSEIETEFKQLTEYLVRTLGAEQR